MIAYQLLEQPVLGQFVLDQRGLHRAVHSQVVPGRNPRQIWIDLGRHIGMRPQEGHHRLRARLQVAPVRARLGHMAQQHKLIALLLRMQRQVRDIGQACIVGADQAGKRVFTHQRQGMDALFGFELRWQVHMPAYFSSLKGGSS